MEDLLGVEDRDRSNLLKYSVYEQAQRTAGIELRDCVYTY